MTTEFSRYFDVSLLQKVPADYTIEASVAECKALAHRFGVNYIKNLKALIHVIPKGKALELEGHFTTEVGWPLNQNVMEKQKIAEAFDETIIVVPSLDFEKREGKAEDDRAQDDEEGWKFEHEMIAAGSALDLGEIVAQYLGLALYDLTSFSKKDDLKEQDGQLIQKPPVKLGDFWPKKD